MKKQNTEFLKKFKKFVKGLPYSSSGDSKSMRPLREEETKKVREIIDCEGVQSSPLGIQRNFGCMNVAVASFAHQAVKLIQTNEIEELTNKEIIRLELQHYIYEDVPHELYWYLYLIPYKQKLTFIAGGNNISDGAKRAAENMTILLGLIKEIVPFTITTKRLPGSYEFFEYLRKSSEKDINHEDLENMMKK